MTYKQLMDCLSKLTEDQLEQPVKFFEGSEYVNSVRIIRENDVWLSNKEPPLLVKE